MLCFAVHVPVRTQVQQPVTELPDSGIIGTPLSSAINTGYQESNPVLSADGRTLYFSRQRHPLNYGLQDKTDIWVSIRLANGEWSRAINIGAPLNTHGDNRVAGIVAGGNRIYLINSDNDLPDEQSGLYYAERRGRSWSVPIAVHIDSLQPGEKNLHFFPGMDEQTLLLSLEQPGGFGQRDLYVTFRKPGGGWSAPQNLGPLINTSGDERRMVLAADGQTLYFSSNGHPGLGGTDLFMSRRLDESWRRWSAPVSLGEAINSERNDDEFTVSADGSCLLLARRSPSGNSDIIEFSLSADRRSTPVTIIQGKIPENGSAPVAYTKFSPALGNTSAGNIAPQVDGTFLLVLPGKPGYISLFMQGEEYFGPSRCIMPGGAHFETLDTPETPILFRLQQNADYRQREGAIKDISNQIRETRKQQLSFRKKVRAYESFQPTLPFDTTLLRRDELRDIAEKYQAFLRETAGAYQGSKGVSTGEPGRPDSSADRLKKLRRRYRKYHDDEVVITLKNTPPPASSLKTFEDYCRERWRETVEKQLPVVKRSLDSAMVEERLQSRRSSSQPDLLQIRFLEKQQQRFSERPPARDNILLPFEDREGQLKKEMEGVICPLVSERLRELLREPAREALNDRLREHHKSIHLANLERSLQALLQRQMALEQSQPPLQAPPGDTPAQPASQYREIKVELNWIRLEQGQIWPLHSVLFEANSSQLLPLAFAELERVARLLKKHPDFGVEVAAHTHGKLSHRQAQQISAARADVVARKLIGLGLPGNRVQSRGYGRCFPIAEDETIGGKRQNQRVELRLFKMEQP